MEIAQISFGAAPSFLQMTGGEKGLVSRDRYRKFPALQLIFDKSGRLPVHERRNWGLSMVLLICC